MSKEIIRGQSVTIEFDAAKCIHSRHCVLDRPDVFVPNVEGAWIRPDAATPGDVVALARNCPSGAIVARRTDGGADEAPPLVNTVRVLENGPLAVRASLTIKQAFVGYRATLCRCGQSQHKPYCDGSHATAGFRASGESDAKESAALAERGGPVEITPTENGPLKLLGSVEVITGTGHTINRATKLFLCRCGHSKSKPYCDGSHKTVGFIAP
jgi:CDGSH-type Zn-finger protein/uncharacterized Fe-S cluster protein YjdI